MIALRGEVVIVYADFLIFGVHYDNLAAEGDQNGDGATDDADFLIFVVHYNELVCPSCN